MDETPISFEQFLMSFQIIRYRVFGNIVDGDKYAFI